ncbi:uncharacterized protein [Oscarella lobularis]|uniref:uncharacterized protein n=1 Tax=Oscarella lobularis TaxID=121494 RepID=UPI003313A217
MSELKKKFLRKSRRLIRRSQDDKSDGLVRPRGDGNSDGELPDVNPIRAKAKTKAHDWPLLKSNSLVAKRHDPKEFALSVQSKVNSELKRLLVASVGADIQERIQRLVEENAELQCRVRRFDEKSLHDAEGFEQLMIQADVWRSKFLASSMMVDEMAAWKAKLFIELKDCQKALRRILEERDLIREHLRSCCRHIGSNIVPGNDVTVLQLAKLLDRILRRDASATTVVQMSPEAAVETQAREALASSEAFLTGDRYFVRSVGAKSARSGTGNATKGIRSDGSWNTYSSTTAVFLFSEIGHKTGDTFIV